jgi:hypothetical protein
MVRRQKRNILRVRLIRETQGDGPDEKYAALTLKGNAQLVNGISRVEEASAR